MLSVTLVAGPGPLLVVVASKKVSPPWGEVKIWVPPGVVTPRTVVARSAASVTGMV